MTQVYGPYSPYKEANGFVFVSGQIGIKPGDENAADDVSAQTTQCMQNLAAVLEEAGLELKDIVKTTIYLTDMDNYKAVNDVYTGFFYEAKPARAAVGVSELPHIGDTPLLIEIEAIAAR